MLSSWVGTLLQTKIGIGWITFFTKGPIRAKYVYLAYGKIVHIFFTFIIDGYFCWLCLLFV